MHNRTNLLGGTLLVSGTCIGGGVLALPVLTSLGGFIPSLLIFFLCWLFMVCTGLLLLEVCHAIPGEINLVSMAEKTLGKIGKGFAWSTYLFLFYSLTLAYIVGCSSLFTHFFSVPHWMGSLLLVLLLGPIVLAGPHLVGKINLFLMLGLGISYATFVYYGYSFVNQEYLQQKNWQASLLALPVAFTSFGFQGIIPTLHGYMKNDIKKTRFAILVGSFIPLIAYMIWEWLILGIVPIDGDGGLAQALELGENAVQPLRNLINNPYIFVIGQYFAFFALTTSFFGVTLGLHDFLADGLKIKKNTLNRMFLALLVFLPPLILAMTYPHIFLTSLSIAGGLGCALLLGLLPVLMAWSGRYRRQWFSDHLVPGGKGVLFLLISFVLVEITFELIQLFG